MLVWRLGMRATQEKRGRPGPLGERGVERRTIERQAIAKLFPIVVQSVSVVDRTA